MKVIFVDTFNRETQLSRTKYNINLLFELILVMPTTFNETIKIFSTFSHYVYMKIYLKYKKVKVKIIESIFLTKIYSSLFIIKRIIFIKNSLIFIFINISQSV